MGLGSIVFGAAFITSDKNHHINIKVVTDITDIIMYFFWFSFFKRGTPLSYSVGIYMENACDPNQLSIYNEACKISQASLY